MFLLDTDTCIHVLKNRPKTLARFKNEGSQSISVSAITRYELLFGAKRSGNPKKHLAKVELFLAPLLVHSFTPKTAGFAADLKAHLAENGTMIGAHDILIAATALEQGLTVVTGNLREFTRVPKLKVETWSS